MSRLQVRIAGAFYYRSAVLKTCLGDSVTLVHEPDNEHDFNAVAIMHNAGKIGYIPRDVAPTYREHINNRRIVRANISEYQTLSDIFIVVEIAEPRLTLRETFKKLIGR